MQPRRVLPAPRAVLASPLPGLCTAASAVSHMSLFTRHVSCVGVGLLTSLIKSRAVGCCALSGINAWWVRSQVAYMCHENRVRRSLSRQVHVARCTAQRRPLANSLSPKSWEILVQRGTDTLAPLFATLCDW